MSTEFTREDRYIVFKLSDVERYLTDADRAHLAMMKNEIDAGRDCANKPPFKGLIVESDWPEYEPTWKAIEARVTGAQPAPSVLEGYKLVPIEPTPTMITAALESSHAISGKNALLKAARLRGFCVSACTFACTRITPHTDIQHRRLAQQGNPSEQTKGHRQRCDRH